jgi:hypothetical protein
MIHNTTPTQRHPHLAPIKVCEQRFNVRQYSIYRFPRYTATNCGNIQWHYTRVWQQLSTVKKTYGGGPTQSAIAKKKATVLLYLIRLWAYILWYSVRISTDISKVYRGLRQSCMANIGTTLHILQPRSSRHCLPPSCSTASADLTSAVDTSLNNVQVNKQGTTWAVGYNLAWW